MDVASLCPLPVGVVRWHGPRPRLTVVVKATFSLHGRERPPLAPAQLGIQCDAAGATGTADELELASDFAPQKARTDVLVVGHAKCNEPHPAWPIALKVGSFEKRFSAVPERSTRKVPLQSSFLRREPWKDSVPVRVGPRPQRVPGWASRAVTEGFDFGRFNVAPDDQQIPELLPGTRVVLEGMFDFGAVELLLPALAPAVYLVPERGAAGRAVPMRCDTLWLHTDRELFALTWRGVVDAPADGAFVVVDASAERLPDWASVAERLPHARWGRAADESDVRPEVPAPAASGARVVQEPTVVFPSTARASGTQVQIDDEPTLIRKPEPASSHQSYATIILGDEDELAPPAPDPAQKTLTVLEDEEPPARRGRAETVQFDGAPAAASRPLPFAVRPSDRPPANPDQTAQVSALHVPAPALPFGAAERDMRSSDRPPAPSQTAIGADETAQGGAFLGPPLPFATAPARAYPASAPPRSPPQVSSWPPPRSDPPPPLKSDPPAAPPIESRSAEPELLPLETYASVKVALVLDGRPVEQVLKEHGLDPLTWRLEERRRADALSQAADRGDLGPMRELRRAMRHAQRHAKPRS